MPGKIENKYSDLHTQKAARTYDFKTRHIKTESFLPDLPFQMFFSLAGLCLPGK